MTFNLKLFLFKKKGLNIVKYPSKFSMLIIREYFSMIYTVEKFVNYFKIYIHKSSHTKKIL